MPTLHAVYSREHSLGSVAVRIGSWWEQWGHCGIVAPSGLVIEAMARPGVVRTPLPAFEARSSKVSHVQIECSFPERGIAFADAQVGKPYDWGGVVAIPFRARDWAKAERWFCSELLEAALIEAGRTRFRKGIRRVTPSMSFNVL